MSKRAPSAARASRGPSQRQLRAGELIRHALTDIIAREDLRDPELDGVSVTISEVRASADLRQATVFCAPLGGGDPKTTAAALNRCAAFLRGKLGRVITLKFTPALRFAVDASFDEASRIDHLLKRPEVARDLRGDAD